MAWRPSTPEEWEIARRSVAMLAANHPCALDRTAAMWVLDEVERLKRREQQLLRLVDGLQALLADVAAPRPSQ